MTKRTPTPKKTVTEANLLFLGEARLAALLTEAASIDPALKRRLRMELAAEVGAPFHGVWLEAAPEVLAARIEGREGDASDATVATLRMQLERDVGPINWVRVDASGPAQDAAEAWSATYGGLPLP